MFEEIVGTGWEMAKITVGNANFVFVVLVVVQVATMPSIQQCIFGSVSVILLWNNG